MEATVNFTKHIILSKYDSPHVPPSACRFQLCRYLKFLSYLCILESVTFMDAVCMQLVSQLSKLCLRCYRFKY